jgi:HEAT repeat protein
LISQLISHDMRVSQFFLILTSIISSIALAPDLASANEWVRPQVPADLAPSDMNVTAENAYPVEGVQVAWANYSALKRDFPALRPLSNKQINEWLVKNFSYIGTRQSHLNNIRNSSIPIDKTRGTKLAYRPQTWNRAAVLEGFSDSGESMGMVDIKGFGHGLLTTSDVEDQTRQYDSSIHDPAGIDKLRVSDHSDGLMSLGEAIAEVTRQQAAQRMFERSGTGMESVESYAILKLPFDILKEKEGKTPAALYLRQAHQGRESGLPVPEKFYHDFSGLRQYTDTLTAVDFGAVVFDDPDLDEHWGRTDASERVFDAQKRKPWLWAHSTADAYAKEGDPSIIARHIGEMAESVERWMNRHPELFPADEASKYREISEKSRAFLEKNQRMNFEELKRRWNNGRNWLKNWVRTLLSESDNDYDRLTETTFNIVSQLSDEDALPLVKAALKSQNPPLRAYAVKALRGRTGADTLSLLTIAMADPDEEVRIQAVAALAGRSDPSALALLHQAINDPRSKVQSEVITTLNSLEGQLPKPYVEEIVTSNAPLPIRTAALKSLTRQENTESLKLIENFVRDPELAMKSAAAFALKNRQDPQSLQLIEKMFKSSFTNSQAVRALEGRTDPESWPLVEQAFQDPELRENAVKAMKGRSEEASYRLLREALDDKSRPVREEALKSLSGRDPQKTIPLFNHALSDKDPFLRNKLVEVTLQQRSPAFLPLVESLIKTSKSPIELGKLQFLKSILDRTSVNCTTSELKKQIEN